ncbi:MAG: glycosyltransferase, partial [Solirubrobacterales bacterium]|nr:glycosyltransferase [Solirubrobacterales bacterium]
VLVHTAPSEPFGRALIDAMAAGRPVIAFDAAGPREIVTPDCGRLVPAESPAALAAAISEICADPTLAQAMGAAGRRRVAADFDAVHQATKWQRAALSLAPLPAGSKLVGPSAVEGQNTGGEHAGTGSETSIVTVIHNSAPELSRLLSSIARYLPAAEVIVVDSGSTDGGSSIAATWPGNATVLMLDGNEGYGAGCVTGMTAATRPITALINPDVELVDASLAGLTTELLSPNAPDRLLSPLLIHPDGQRQDAVHPLPGTAREFVRALIPAQALPGRLAALAEPHRSNRSVRVGWAVGACLLGRTETLRLLGPFDPAVHLYAEDLDLCLRAADRGIETWYHPEARVIHREAHSTRQAFDGEPSRLLAQRRRQVVGERLGRFAQQRDDAVQWITLCDRILLKEILRRDTAKERARLSGLREARRA